MKTIIMCDPPEGWKYGFPKPIPKDKLGKVSEWLISEGYPKDLAENVAYWRYWEEEVES